MRLKMTSNKQIYNTVCDNLNLIKYNIAHYTILLGGYNFPSTPIEGFFIKLDCDDRLYLASGVHYYRNKVYYNDWQPYTDKQLTRLITQCKTLELEIKKDRMNKKLQDIENDFK